jgi:DNA-binding NarL/FixJ family response regulator
VVIADDQTLVRGGFRLILHSAGIPVVAEATDGKEAVAAALSHRPDVVLMDIRMPEMDGLEATRRILAAQGAQGAQGGGADVRITMLTTFDLDQYVYAALSAGASGFLLKDVSPEHLIAAVRLVRRGDVLLAPSITRRLVERFAPRAAAASGGDLSCLTPRELEVLGLVARDEQRRARRRADAERGDGEDPRGPDPGQATAAGPGAGGRAGLRDRAGLAGP